jgi:hypothetical protein
MSERAPNITVEADGRAELESTVTTALVEGKSLFVAPDGDGSHPRMPRSGRPAAMLRPRRWENAQAASDGDSNRHARAALLQVQVELA